MQTNYLPTISGSDIGIWSRVKVVPWNESFLEHVEGDLDATLALEAPGILNWMIEGCIRWQRDGLKDKEPETTVRATIAYRHAEDVLTYYAKDVGLVFEAGKTVLDFVLELSIEAWAANEGIERPSAKKINDWMKGQGATEGRQRYVREDGIESRSRVWKGAGYFAPGGAA
jgi:putative DNA primase/helicase